LSERVTTEHLALDDLLANFRPGSFDPPWTVRPACCPVAAR
jgi:hypothetical protein